MLFSHIYLPIFFLILPFLWTYVVKDDGEWPWNKTKYLTRSNWTSSLKPNNSSTKLHHPVWFVFKYLTYCGYCKTAEPGWEAAAQYAAGWSRYIKIGAYDCAGESESQTDICVDEGYPQWRIFCPLTNSTQLAFDSGRRTNDTKPEDILLWSIKKINKIAPECYGKSWPIRQIIQPQTKDDLSTIIPKSIKKFQLFISDDILLYSLYVLNNSKTVFKEPIYRLATDNLMITQGVGIWKGMRDDNGQISLEQIDSTKAMEPFVFNTNVVSHTDKSPSKPIGSIKPTSTDIDSAVVWMITKDLRRKLPSLFEDVKTWLHVLHTYYPGSNTMKHFLHDLISFMNNHTTLSSKEFQNYINSTSIIKLPDIKFDHCNGSDPSKRGYPCALWILFHSMSVKQAILAEQNQLSSNVTSTQMLVSIREFVRKFFLCEECRKHFINMTSNVENEINSYKESVLFLWRSHNKVNQRLRNDELLNDLAWPKVPFPTKQQCNSCVRQVNEDNDAIAYDENETYNYLKEYYNLENMSDQKDLHSKQNIARNQRYNHLLVVGLSFLLGFLSV